LHVDPPLLTTCIFTALKSIPLPPMDEDSMHAQIEMAFKMCEAWNGRLPMAEEVEK
jgi:hypothetical protein